MQIFIATPCGRSTVQTSFMTSVIHTMKTLESFGVSSDFGFICSADIVYNRNVLANQFMNNTQCTHLLFVDDDMVFEPKTILKLIKADVDVVGVAAVRRELNLEAFMDECFKDAAKGIRPESAADIASRISTFNVRPFSNERGRPIIIVDEDVLRVEAVGTGVMLIKREALEKMQKSPNIHKHSQINKLEKGLIGEGTFYGYFDKIWDKVSGTFWHEDFSFCFRYRSECDGRIHAFIDDAIGHIGDFVYIGNYLHALLAENPSGIQTDQEFVSAVENRKKAPTHTQQITAKEKADVQSYLQESRKENHDKEAPKPVVKVGQSSDLSNLNSKPFPKTLEIKGGKLTVG